MCNGRTRFLLMLLSVLCSRNLLLPTMMAQTEAQRLAQQMAYSWRKSVRSIYFASRRSHQLATSSSVVGAKRWI